MGRIRGQHTPKNTRYFRWCRRLENFLHPVLVVAWREEGHIFRGGNPVIPGTY